jgi:hypothetical protein
MALACKKTKRASRKTCETPRAKYETAPGASQKIRLSFGYLKIRWGHV